MAEILEFLTPFFVGYGRSALYAADDETPINNVIMSSNYAARPASLA